MTSPSTAREMSVELPTYEQLLEQLELCVVRPSQLPSESRSCCICLEPYQLQRPQRKQRLGLSCLQTPISRPSLRRSRSAPRPQSSRSRSSMSSVSSLGRPPVMDNRATRVPCGHVFGKECIEEWLQSSNQCPLCRQEICQKTPGDNEEYGYSEGSDRESDYDFELVLGRSLANSLNHRNATLPTNSQIITPDFSELCASLWLRLI